METKIHTLKFGINRCYIIQAEGTIMIDGGPPNSIKKFKKYLDELSIDPSEIQLIVLTHADFDHAGSAKDFRELTGAKVMIHRNESEYLENGTMKWAPGVTAWGKISRFIFKPLIAGKKLPKIKADIVIENNEFQLHKFGINGKVIFTPGHSPGHVSVVLENGDCFAGCMAHNIRLFTRKPDFPIYADNIGHLKESWEKLIEMGVKTIYPGHGKSFHVNQIQKIIH
jgi:glyoxylase-like metal-dependent hydrolase (beta-lactamase superfamily II)